MDDNITYEMRLVRWRNGEVDQVINVDGYGDFAELLDDVLEMVEKRGFDVGKQ